MITCDPLWAEERKNLNGNKNASEREIQSSSMGYHGIQKAMDEEELAFGPMKQVQRRLQAALKR